jgi:hypothetical protein
MTGGTSRLIAISVSDSPDLDVLGLMDGDNTRVLNAILTPLIYRGARIAYGGRIKPPSRTNYTTELCMQYSAAYRRGGEPVNLRPYVHYLRDNDARREGVEELFAHALRLGEFSELRVLRGPSTIATLLPTGSIVEVYADGRSLGAYRSADAFLGVDAIAKVFGKPTGRDELADMRKAMAEETNARIIVGGRVGGTVGGASGIAAEAIETLAAGKPLLPLGGLGGASRDIAATLGLIDEADRIERGEDAYRDNRGQPSRIIYWKHMRSLEPYAGAYTDRLAALDLLQAARQLAVSDTSAEISALIVVLLEAHLNEGHA